MPSPQRNELIELYDSLSVMYNRLPKHTDSEWELALRSVLYGDELLAEDAVSYGKQQNERNNFSRREYRRKHRNGEDATEFLAIQVGKPRPQDREYLSSGTVVPVAPDSGAVIPVEVSAESVDRAISLLAEFPAEPAADTPGTGQDDLLDPNRVRMAKTSISNSHEKNPRTSVLFVSDTHLGYENRQKTGRGDKVPWIGTISTADTFTRITTVAIEQEVDAIIHTGDIVDHEVDQETLNIVESRLDLLSQIGIQVYCIIGSHDHTSYEPQHRDSINGIAWLKDQTRKNNLIELTSDSTKAANGELNLYGISAGNVGIDDVGTYQSRSWGATEITFTPASHGLNILCLHDSLTPYRGNDADVDLNRLLSQTKLSFDCVLIGDEHRPKNQSFDTGYTFEARDGTPVFYTGPAIRISHAYDNREAFVTELTVSSEDVIATRHTV